MLLTTVKSVAVQDKLFYVYNSSNGLADNSAQTINCTKTGRLVITTMGQINFFDGQQFSYIDPTTENTFPLTKYNGHAHLYFDKYHHLWLKKRHSLTCVNLLREMFVESVVEEFKGLGMYDQVEDFFVDGQNEVWMLSSKGLYSSEKQKYYPVQPKLNLQDLDTYEDKYLLLFYENGQMDAVDLHTGNTVFSEKAYDSDKAQRYAESSVIHPIGHSVFQIRNGVWNGNNQGILLRFDMDTRKWATVMETPYYLSNMVDLSFISRRPTVIGPMIL